MQQNPRRTDQQLQQDRTVYDGTDQVVRTTYQSRSARRRAAAESGTPPRVSRPAQQPIAADEMLRDERQYASRTQHRRFSEPVYDDDPQPLKKPKHYQPRKHRLATSIVCGVICFICLLCITALGLFAAPQLFGVQFAVLPNYAFVNGSIITMDQELYAQYRQYRRYMSTDAILPGVYIDGVDMAGKTVEEAQQTISQVSATNGVDFQIVVSIGNRQWSIDSSKVPMSRDLSDILQQAYAFGRTNTTAIRGTGVTPFQERVNTAMQLRQQPVGLNTTLSYDRATIRAMTDSIANFVNRDPVNASVATFDFTTRSFTFNDDVYGAYVDPDAMYNQVIAMLDSGNYHQTLRIEPDVILAPVTKAELMNSFRLISSYTTETTSNKNRNTNIDLSAAAINGKTVLPGETFSFNAATGQRTYEKGYREATAIAGGQSVPEVGGGVCQTSSTLFNAVARADLEIVYRSPHAWPSSYVPKGMDATVNWPNLDFKFRNNTDWPIFIVSYYNNRKVTVEIYGMSLGDGVKIDLESKVVQTIKPPSGINYVLNEELPVGTEKKTISARTGYVVETYKIWYRNGEEIRRELMHTSNYKMYQETVEYH